MYDSQLFTPITSIYPYWKGPYSFHREIHLSKLQAQASRYTHQFSHLSHDNSSKNGKGGQGKGGSPAALKRSRPETLQKYHVRPELEPKCFPEKGGMPSDSYFNHRTKGPSVHKGVVKCFTHPAMVHILLTLILCIHTFSFPSSFRQQLLLFHIPPTSCIPCCIRYRFVVIVVRWIELSSSAAFGQSYRWKACRMSILIRMLALEILVYQWQ